MGVFGDIRENVDIKNLEFKKNTRIDMEWLLGFIEQIEQNKNIVEQLKVKSNHAVLKVGKRLELLFPTHCGQGEKIRGNISDTISVRLTAASQYVLEKAKKPITFCNLVDDVYELYNKQVARSVIFDFVWEMFRQEFLISELRPPLLGEKPVDYLIAHLSNITGAEKEILFLEKLQEMIAVYDSESLGKGLDRYRFINQQMQEKIKSKSSLQVDTEFSNVVTINKQIADDFEEAIVQMCRITPITQGYPYMKEYYLKFIEKYGTAVDVPLLELVNKDIGIGYPTYYKTGQYSSKQTDIEQEQLTRRKRVIRNQIESSIMNNFEEVVLTDELIESLTLVDNWKDMLPESMEVYGEIIESSETIDGQEIYAIVINSNSGSFQKGLTLGRFTNFSNEISSTVKQMVQNEQQLNSNIIMVDVTYIPTYGRTANIMLSKNYLAYEMAIGTNVQDKKMEITLDDLYVCADNKRLFLKSKKYKKEVQVMASNMLNFASSPYLFRLLRDISDEAKYQWRPFVWDNGENYIYTPRLRYKNVIFTPAQWNLCPEMFEKKEIKSEEVFYVAFQNIAVKWRIPRYVFVKVADNHLLLDITMKEAVSLLLKDIEKGKTVKLEEFVGEFKDRTLFQDKENHYITEIVFEVERTKCTEKNKKNYPLIKYDNTNSRILFPGKEWLYMNLYCSENTQNEILKNTIAPFANKLVSNKMIEKWFFIKYDDGRPHIRVRFKVSEMQNIGEFFNTVLSWLNDCKQNGEIFDVNIKSYERESARYGGPHLIEVAESIFWEDSQLVIKLLNIFEHENTDNQKILGVLSTIDILNGLGLTRQAQLNLLEAYVDKNLYKQEFRPIRKQILDLISKNEYADRSLEKGNVMQLFTSRTKILSQYGKLLQEQSNILWNNIFDIAASLLHMHFNRLYGVDRDKEKEGLALARHSIYALLQYEKYMLK